MKTWILGLTRVGRVGCSKHRCLPSTAQSLRWWVCVGRGANVGGASVKQDVILNKCLLPNCSSLSKSDFPWNAKTMCFIFIYFHVGLTLLWISSSLLAQLSQSGSDGMLFGGCLNCVRMHLVMDLPALWDSLPGEYLPSAFSKYGATPYFRGRLDIIMLLCWSMMRKECDSVSLKSSVCATTRPWAQQFHGVTASSENIFMTEPQH